MAKDVIFHDQPEIPEPKPTPVVFVSYSHDSPEHKRWVGDLASRLVKAGVDVIIDQWDTGPGDDLPKFMENAVTRANRVLVMCSDVYVQKADDGKGGVGYEAMILTGELVKNLGQNKFIPIIRQSHGNTKKPKFLETKYHIDFSEDASFDEHLEELLREIHKAPRFPKPELGKNPFVTEPQPESISPSLQLDLSVPIEIPNDARHAYFRALEFARRNDRVGWRKFLLRATSVISPRLLEWKRTKGDKLPATVAELPQWVLPGVTSVSPVIAIALAGVESQSDYFRNQVGLIDEFLNPSSWELSGNTVITRFPQMIVFVYQALLGSVAFQTTQPDIAKRLALVEIPRDYGSVDSTPLFQTTKVTGWPDSLNHTCTLAWPFLCQLPNTWEWLNEIFADAEHFKAALCAYYAFLNAVEFVDALKRDLDLSDPNKLTLTVPVSFTVMGDAVSRRAKRLLEENRNAFRELWRESPLDKERKLAKWGEWEVLMGAWIANVYRGHRSWYTAPFHSSFIKSLEN